MKIQKIETNYKEKRFYKKTEESGFEENFDKKENQVIIIYPEFKYQKILGFGGAFTESSGYVFSKFSEDIKKKFISDYFSESR